MKIESGDILVFTPGNTIRKCRISSLDGRMVKFFEEDGTYNQMPYNSLMEMFREGCVRLEENRLKEEL